MTTPDEFDIVVVGTGLVESILAAAFARSGKRVLYVDDAKWYGGDSATLSLTEFSAVLRRSLEAPAPLDAEFVPANAQSRLKGNSLSGIRLLEIVGEPPQCRESDYNIDLTPRLVFCRGSCVDVLAESGVSRYLEFQTLDSTLYLGPEEAPQPIVVPHSKGQVFSSSDIKMVEKRQLMRFLQFCVDYKSGNDVEWTNEKLGAANPGRALTRPQNKSEDAELKSIAIENPDQSLEWFLKEHIRMSPRLCDVVRFAILHQARPSHNVWVREGMFQIGRYLGALGRFGSTPYLTPMYGTGEICQGFSRLCAVYAGVCALGTRPLALSCKTVYFGEPARDAEHYGDRLPPQVRATLACIVGASYLDSSQSLSPGEAAFQEVRCVAIVSKSLVGENLGRVAFVLHPSGEDDPLIFGIQLDHIAKAAPQGRFVVHLSARTSSDPQDIDRVKSLLQTRLNALCETRAAQLFYAAYYAKRVLKSSNSSDLFIVGDANSDWSSCMVVDADTAFDQAKAIFESVLPGEPFLPPSETELQARREEALLRAVPDLDD